MMVRRADASANRQQLLEAARRVFAEKGLAAEVKEIASAAGVGVGTLYRNFPRKEDLVLALLQEAQDFIRSAYEEAEASDGSPIDQLRLILGRAFDASRVYGWMLEALWSGQLPAGWQETSRDEENLRRFRSILSQAVELGMIRQDLDLDIAIAMLSGPLVLQPRIPVHLTPTEAADRVIDAWFTGARFR